MNLHFEGIIEERVSNGIPPGVIFSRIDGQGAEHFSYGVSSLDGGQRPDLDTRFEIGSNTKVFLALLVVKLSELGILSLTDLVRDYLPAFVRFPERGKSCVSFLDILTHTSALPRMPPNFNIGDMASCFAEYDIDDLYEGLGQLSLDWNIGDSYVYSNLGYALLGHIVELVTGESWDELVKKYICSPLGMNNTSPSLSKGADNVAISHQGRQPVANMKFGIFGAAGGLTSSARDMSKFLTCNLGLVESELSSSMQIAKQLHYRESEIFGIGLGWHIQQRSGQNIIWHRGETHGQTSFMAFEPQAKTAITMLSNSAFSGCCSDLALSQLSPHIKPAEHQPHDVLNLPVESLKQLEGEYALDNAISFTILAEENHLNISVTGQAGGAMYPVAPNQFETQDQRVIVCFSDDKKMITIRQHGIDRIAYRG